jgi:hypothetical protein
MWLGALLRVDPTKAGDKAGNVTGTSHFLQTFNGSVGQRGQTMAASGPFDFSKYRRPQFEEPLRRAAESEDDQMPPENLSDLLGRASETSMGGIDSLIGEFEGLRGKLRTDGERLQREIEEYNALSQQVMQLTKTISESVEKVRASVDRPQEKE